MSKQANKGLVPELRFPVYRMRGGDWQEKALGDVADIITGTTPATANTDYYGGDRLFITPADISEGRHVTQSRTTLTEDGFAQTRHIRENSVLFVCIGSTIGKVAQNSVDCSTNQQINSLVNKPGYSSDFLYSLLECFAPKIAALAGKQAVPLINKSQFSAIAFPFPSPDEQQEIATCLSSLDALLAAERERLEALRAHKKGLMQQLFPAEGATVPALRFPGFGGEWEEKALRQLFTIGSGKDYKHLGHGTIPVYGTGGYMLSVDDFLYDGESACIGRKGTIDKPILLSGKFWTVDTLFYTHSFKDCSPRFVYLIFQMINWLQYNEAGGVPSLSKTIIEEIRTMVPSADEQERIISCIFSLDDSIKIQAERITALEEHKKGLLQGLFPSHS